MGLHEGVKKKKTRFNKRGGGGRQFVVCVSRSVAKWRESEQGARWPRSGVLTWPLPSVLCLLPPLANDSRCTGPDKDTHCSTYACNCGARDHRGGAGHQWPLRERRGSKEESGSLLLNLFGSRRRGQQRPQLWGDLPLEPRLVLPRHVLALACKGRRTEPDGRQVLPEGRGQVPVRALEGLRSHARHGVQTKPRCCELVKLDRFNSGPANTKSKIMNLERETAKR